MKAEDAWFGLAQSAALHLGQHPSRGPDLRAEVADEGALGRGARRGGFGRIHDDRNLLHFECGTYCQVVSRQWVSGRSNRSTLNSQSASQKEKYEDPLERFRRLHNNGHTVDATTEVEG
jgi:hypothetical protein